jgi:hypothetical protein
MKNNIRICCVLLCVASAGVFAVEADRCSILLQDGVRNRLSETYDKKFLDEFHSAMCSENSKRIDDAKNLGINLGYEDFVLDFAGNAKNIASYQESMCSARDRVTTGSTFYKMIKNHVSVDLVSGFNECVRITEGGMDFSVTKGKDGDSITIDVGYSRDRTPRAELEVTHVVINPESLEDKVDCKGPLAKVKDGETVKINQPIGIQGITCRPGKDFPKIGDNDFSVVLHTTVGHIEGHVKPYYTGKSDRLTDLEKKYSELNSDVTKLAHLQSMNTRGIKSTDNVLSALISNLSVSVHHYSTGSHEHKRKHRWWGPHYGCGQDAQAQNDICGAGVPRAATLITAHDGGSCGLNYYILTCTKK